MRSIPSMILACLFVCLLANSAFSATYYVRTDGGTADQCTGLADAAYPGSGTGQACAWSHPFWALSVEGAASWKLSGGDVLIIGPGEYQMGYGAPNTGWCETEYPWDCHLPPLPSGIDANNPTRIFGKGYDTGCANPPQLWGTQRANQIISLENTNYAQVGCLEITDHSKCVEFHSDSAMTCERDSWPYGDWAVKGIQATDSANVYLFDLNIHGMGYGGIKAGRLTDWTVDRVRLAANGWVGWDGDVYGDDNNTGTLTFRNWTVEWNGCGETYPGEQPTGCWSQTAGGYGDGVGTGATGGHWIIEDSIFRYNTSDGLDLLYTRVGDSQIDIRRSQAYGNAGNQFKTNGNVSIENSLTVSECSFHQGKSFTYNVDACRAGGSAVSLTLRKGNKVSVINTTVAGEGDCLLTGECETTDGACDGSEQVIIQNSIFKGYPEYNATDDQACYAWFGDGADYFDFQMDYNLVYDAKISQQTLSAHDLSADPLFVNGALASFDGRLTASSPAIDAGLAVGSLNGLVPGHDINQTTRPNGNGVDLGCYEYVAATTSELVVGKNPGKETTSVAANAQVALWINTTNSRGDAPALEMLAFALTVKGAPSPHLSADFLGLGSLVRGRL